MRAGMSREWSGTLAGFDAAHYTNRLGIEKVRADDPADVRHAIDRAGGEAVHWYGVRLFTDHWPNEPAPDIEEALAAEEEAGRRDPYRALAALTHTLATAPPNRQTTSDAKSANIHIPADS